MNILSDVITYVRRIIKTQSDSEITDNLIIDYINRFWLVDIDARVQLFDFKTKYQFQTVPGVDQYNMPLYNAQTLPGGGTIAPFPMYQGFMEPVLINGRSCSFHTERRTFLSVYPDYVQSPIIVGTGNGTAGPYTLNIPFAPTVVSSVNQPAASILRGHVDITGIIATGSNIDPPVVTSLNTSIPSANTFPAIYFTSIGSDGSSIVVSDSGQFLMGNVNNGLLMKPGNTVSIGNTALPNGYSSTVNTINYVSGVANVYFPAVIPSGQNINAQCYFYNPGLPRCLLYYNNILKIRTVPDTQYLVELDAYLSPAAFLSSSSSLPFAYMAEYIARGAARKILSDTGDIEQFNFYEGLFREQEILVWKRSQRQVTATRTPTMFSQGIYNNNGSYGGCR